MLNILKSSIAMKMTVEERTEMKSERAKAYYQSNKEECKRRMREYRARRLAEDPDMDKRYRRAFRERNPEKCAEYARKYYQEHRESSLERSKKWRREHPERVKEYQRKYHLKSLSELGMSKRKEEDAAKVPSFDKIKSLFKNPEDAEKHYKWLSERSKDKKESEVDMK